MIIIQFVAEADTFLLVCLTKSALDPLTLGDQGVMCSRMKLTTHLDLVPHFFKVWWCSKHMDNFTCTLPYKFPA